MSILLILLVIAVGIAAAVISRTVSLNSMLIVDWMIVLLLQTMDFSSTLSDYSNDQSVQEAWNAVQENVS